MRKRAWPRPMDGSRKRCDDEDVAPERACMKATQFEFRFRLLIILLIYALGFWAPWTWASGRLGPPAATAWLALATTLGGWGLHLDQATLLVTGLAILFGLTGAVLRVWGTGVSRGVDRVLGADARGQRDGGTT